MLERGKIIEDVLIALGNISSFNDNLSDEYKVAIRLLDNTISDLNKNTRFLFNSLTEKLNYAQLEQNHLGEYVYYRPKGLVNLLGGSHLRMEGEYILSKIKDDYITYSRAINFNEIPDYMEDYIKGSLGIKMTIAFSQYNDKLNYFDSMMNEELIRIQANELNSSSNVSYLEKAFPVKHNWITGG